MVKRVIADADVSVDAEWWADEIWIQNYGIRTSLVNIRRLKTARRADEGEYFDVAAPHGRAAESKSMQQTRVSVGSVTTAAAKCEMRSIVIIIELSYRIVYRDNFDLSYRSETVFGIS